MLKQLLETLFSRSSPEFEVMPFHPILSFLKIIEICKIGCLITYVHTSKYTEMVFQIITAMLGSIQKCYHLMQNNLIFKIQLKRTKAIGCLEGI